MHYRLARSKRSFIEIAHNTSEQTIVACRDAVMIIQGNAGDGIDEYPVFARIIHLIGQTRIQGVDSFNDKDGARLQFQLLSIKLP